MIHLVKRTDLSKRQENTYRAFGILVAFLATALVILMLKQNPITIYKEIILGALGTVRRFQSTVNNKVIPLVILSLGVSIAFKMKFWNIGAEGQMAMGGFAASFFALKMGNLSPFILLPLMAVAGIVAGGLFGLVPAILKTKLGTNETLVTLMMNYIALNWLLYLQNGPWSQNGFPQVEDFSDNAILPSVFGIQVGWIIALALVILVYIMMNKSKLGYQITVIGENPRTAGYAGINVFKITIIAIMISGAFCGLAGMIQCSAVENTLSLSFTAGLGFTAVITAWLARLSPLGVIISSFAFAIFMQGSSFLQTEMQISSNVSGVLQGVLIFFVLGFEFFLEYKVKFSKKESLQKEGAQ